MTKKGLNSVQERQAAIAELIKNNAIEDQATLVELIKQKYGIDTNQSIVSRDLRQLGVSKQVVGSKSVYNLQQTDASQEILRLAVVEVVHNESLIIIKSLPGLSNFIADYLDMQEHDEILATIAGENVIFVAPTSTKNIEISYKKICLLLDFKK